MGAREDEENWINKQMHADLPHDGGEAHGQDTHFQAHYDGAQDGANGAEGAHFDSEGSEAHPSNHEPVTDSDFQDGVEVAKPESGAEKVDGNGQDSALTGEGAGQRTDL